MPTFLVFALEAPLGALGDIAVGERRYGADRPAKSAIIGLLAAALGIERAKDGDLAGLAGGYGYALRADSPGPLVEDFHTAQVPPARRGKRWATRRDELRDPDLGTILSLRDYRADAAFTVVLWAREAAPFTLERLAEALRRPYFTLYLGRKACPLGRPPAPQLVVADDLLEAFTLFDERDPGRVSGNKPGARIFADLDVEPWLGESLVEQALVYRRDAPISRHRWQFGLRPEIELAPSPDPVS